MEPYVTAEIELVRIAEDVITASSTESRQVLGCVNYFDPATSSTVPAGWTVYYDDNTSANFSGPDKPSVCP